MSEERSLVSAFLEKFAALDFFTDLTRLILYPTSFQTEEMSRFSGYLRRFFQELEKHRRHLPNPDLVLQRIKVLDMLLNVKEKTFLTYENVYRHIPEDTAGIRIVVDAVNVPLRDDESFRRAVDGVLGIIEAFYEVVEVKGTLGQLEDLLKRSKSDSIFDLLKRYRDTILESYSRLTELKALTKREGLRNYYVLSGDESSERLADMLVEYVGRGRVYRSGYSLLDDGVFGFESATVHLISAPSNHAKSLFLVNLCRNVVCGNRFQPDEAVIFVTLEDDIYKLTRRFISVFGNCPYDLVRRLFHQTYGAREEKRERFRHVFAQLIRDAVISPTEGRAGIVLRHSSENTFSPGDLNRFIDRLRVDGLKVRAVFFDYVDVAVPTLTRYLQTGDYDQHGQIVHELRALARHHQIPVITVTQSRREAERLKQLASDLVGDSYKKVRYTDFLYMMCQREDLDPLDEPVRRYVLRGDFPKDEKLIARTREKLVPLEVKVTKSKDSERNIRRFLLLCRENLRIYETVDDYFQDILELEYNRRELQNKIVLLSETKDKVYVSESLNSMNPSQAKELPTFLV